ncbi:MAG: hypothetical protein ACFB13_03010 [Kiloniellaceae bacterium]
MHNRGKRARVAAVAAGLLVLAACSTADYSKPVNDFAAATGNAEQALVGLNTEVTTGYKSVLDDRILGNRAFLRAASPECLTDSKRCRLTVTSDAGNEFYPPEFPLQQMTLLMGRVNAYAGNLKALLEADTAAKVAGNVNAALGSIQNLAETVAKAGGPASTPVPAFATPAGAAVNWVVGQYVASVKVKGLRDATKAAKPVVRDAADLFALTASIIADVPRSTLAEEVSLANDTYQNDRSSKAALVKLTQAAAQYDALLTADPPQVFKRLGDAHDALADALQGGDVTLSTAISKIEAFAAEAKNLAKIVKDLRALAPER